MNNPALASREAAADMACISEYRMILLETGRTIPRIDEMNALERLYNDPGLRRRFCKDACPFRVNQDPDDEKERRVKQMLEYFSEFLDRSA